MNPPVLDLTDLPAVDGHCHPLLAEPVSRERVLDCFSEGRAGSMTEHVVHTGYLGRALRRLAKRFECEPTVDAVLARRAALGAAGPRGVFAASGIRDLLVDTGYPPAAMSLQDMRRTLPCAIHEVFRIETCAQGLLTRALSYEEFLATFRAALIAAADEAVALKSIIAYRSGLAIRAWEPAEGARAYHEAVARVEAGGSARLADKPLLDTLFEIALGVCRDTGRPLQIHSGFGDPDIDLVTANPLLLRPLLEDARWTGARIVLLHMAYPYAREAAFMAAVWPAVYVDLSLALPFLGPAAALPLIEMLSLAPADKVMYGSDVGALPELFALSAEWGRAALGDALGWLIERDGITEGDGRSIARRVLADNAVSVYGLAP